MFLDALRFPLDVARGCVGGPERRTEIVTVGNGREERNQRWQDSRRRWNAGLGLRTADDLCAVLDLFEESRGRLHSFRFRDWQDWKSCRPSQTPAPTDQVLGVGDDAQTDWTLRKSYGVVNPWWRDITKPAAGTVRVALDGVEAGSGWSVDHATGVVSFAAPPAAGVEISAGFEFDVPVRFGADALSVDWSYFDPAGSGCGTMPDIELLEVLE